MKFKFIKLLKHGAMFGLDARIALAIFGALSVISGAALYSAIQDAKATSMLTDFNEIAKAYEQYLLDTGSHISYQNPADEFSLNVKNLVENVDNVPNWNGPYISARAINDTTISYKEDYIVYLTLFNDPEYTAAPATRKCTAGDTQCGLWLQIGRPTNTSDEALFKAIDIKVDGSVSPGDGNFQWFNTTVAPIYIYANLKFMPMPAP